MVRRLTDRQPCFTTSAVGEGERDGEKEREREKGIQVCEPQSVEKQDVWVYETSARCTNP